jgi:hypothetical protein
MQSPDDCRVNTAMKIREIVSPRNIRPDWLAGNFYHGTARTNSEFHPSAVAYFTPNIKDAHEHARMDSGYGEGTPRVIRANLSVQNPAVLDEREMQDLHSNLEAVERLQALGYDSAISQNNTGEVAVFGNRHIHIKDISAIPA